MAKSVELVKLFHDLFKIVSSVTILWVILIAVDTDAVQLQLLWPQVFVRPLRH